MIKQQTYHIDQAILALDQSILALRRAVYRLARACPDDDTFELVLSEIKTIGQYREQAGLHLLKKDGND